jgi:hypothetical protein
MLYDDLLEVEESALLRKNRDRKRDDRRSETRWIQALDFEMDDMPRRLKRDRYEGLQDYDEIIRRGRKDRRRRRNFWED